MINLIKHWVWLVKYYILNKTKSISHREDEYYGSVTETTRLCNDNVIEVICNQETDNEKYPYVNNIFRKVWVNRYCLCNRKYNKISTSGVEFIEVNLYVHNIHYNKPIISSGSL